MSKINIWAKMGLVIAGYILACLAASGAVYVNGLMTPADVKLASAGMSAFGDMILFIGAFGFFALFPTGLAIYFLIRGFLSRRQSQNGDIT